MRRIMIASDYARYPTKSNKRKRKEESDYMKKISWEVIIVYKKELGKPIPD